nr:hypothetical protein [Tanacetum cinerariifolium]
PDLPPPLKGSISKSKRPTRSSNSKPFVTIDLQKFWNVSNRMGKGNKVVGGMNENKIDGGESRDEGAGGEMTSSVFSDFQSLDYRSCRDSVSEKEAQAGAETDLISNVDINDVKEGGFLVDGGNNSNATFSFNNVEKWPSLSRNYGIDVNGDNVDNGSGGANKSGGNKLKLVSMYVNDQGKRVVDMDPLIEKGSKNWSMTLVGMFWKMALVDRWVAIVYSKMGCGDVISSMIGNLIIMDRITMEMCDRSYGRASFARVLIKVDADLGLIDKVEVWYKRLGKSMELRMEFLWKPPVFSHCKVYGHGLDRCLKRTLNVAEKKLYMGKNAQGTANVVHGDNSNIGWKTMNNRKSRRNDDTNRGMYRQRNYYGAGSSKGGLNGRGRGGMNGRGVGDQRFNNNVGGKNINEGGSSSKGNTKKGFDSQNMFFVLSDAAKIEKRLEWDSIRERIDEACEKGLRISMKEKNDWTEDLWVYSKEKMQELVRKENVADLRNVYDEVYRDEHDRIEEMIMKKQLAEAELFLNWAKAYEGMVNQIRMENYEDMNKELRKKFVGKVCSDVFGIWEWVSNTTDSCKGCRIVVGWDPLVISATLLARSNQAMHFSVRSLFDNKLLYVSVLYGEITYKSRSRLWRNLRDHMSIAGSEPWILLGDFNIQKMMNPELGVLKKLDRVLGNAQFISSYPASFVVFMPYLSFDHCPCALTLPELITRKPRPFRFMNFLANKKEFMISDADSLFNKRLDADDKEIKEALFSIDDNKASGPNGYSFNSSKLRGLQSSDNILLAQEFMRNYTWGNMAKNCAFKVIFLRHMTLLVGLPLSFVLETKRGLWQGDLISPYPFTLIMEVLNLMIKRHVRNDGRFKYHSGCGKLEITSLCFADDLLLLCYGDLISASILRRGLDEFSLSSGLYPNMSKSEAFFCGLTPEIKNDILTAMPFKEGTLPIKYLGVPLVSKKINVNDCKILIEVIQNRITDWKNRNLSYAGRLLFISSVLASLQVY